MDSKLDLKLLKKLADQCRKSGIKEFKGYGMEFSLADHVPASNYKKSKEKQFYTQEEVETEGTLTEDELLFWSTADIGSTES